MGDGWWLNAGAVGLPANDGVPGGWYMVLSSQAGGVTASWRRLHYDAAPERAAMARRGLSPAYADALANGLWPSLDVLPAAERRLTGLPLAPPPLEIPSYSAGAKDCM